MKLPRTPDGRYFVHNGRLWRCTDPSLPEERREVLVRELMAARRAVKRAKEAEDEVALRAARDEVQRCKVALGERGPVWWDDGAEDFNRRMVVKTPYREWWAELQRRSGDEST